MKERFRKTLALNLVNYTSCLQPDEIQAFKNHLTHLKTLAGRKKRRKHWQIQINSDRFQITSLCYYDLQSIYSKFKLLLRIIHLRDVIYEWPLNSLRSTTFCTMIVVYFNHAKACLRMRWHGWKRWKTFKKSWSFSFVRLLWQKRYFFHDFHCFRPCKRMCKHAFAGQNTQQMIAT